MWTNASGSIFKSKLVEREKTKMFKSKENVDVYHLNIQRLEMSTWLDFLCSPHCLGSLEMLEW